MDRGQTAQDFALGIGVFLLTVSFVFSSLPTFLSPSADPITHAEEVGADRVAATAVDHLSVDENPTRLDPDATAAFFVNHSSGSALRSFFGLPRRMSVNVTVRFGSKTVRMPGPAGSNVPLAAGDRITERPTATTVRIVSFPGRTACTPRCLLEVRIW